MIKARVIKIICLGCRGSGQLGWIKGRCPRCEGQGRVPVAQALAMADERHAIAAGGLASGDYNLSTLTRLRGEADAIYAIAGVTPSWQAEVAR
ncbi:hypothetical protein MYG64_04705 [Ensifer adhaerens]|uniref:hypothetical protein n=1 Tax=Ensifer adhaerens TaxID=106592 RepID=UPI00210130CD|nr:hypothetical protein [Ensifer adhaerens]UTV37621.1 hypothetical protein MYG64_04705 [Ensifer adhaerens]